MASSPFVLLKKEPRVFSELVWAQHLRRKSEGMCLDRFAHDGRGKFLAVGQWLLCVVKRFG